MNKTITVPNVYSTSGFVNPGDAISITLGIKYLKTQVKKGCNKGKSRTQLVHRRTYHVVESIPSSTTLEYERHVIDTREKIINSMGVGDLTCLGELK